MEQSWFGLNTIRWFLSLMSVRALEQLVVSNVGRRWSVVSVPISCHSPVVYGLDRPLLWLAGTIAIRWLSVFQIGGSNISIRYFHFSSALYHFWGVTLRMICTVSVYSLSSSLLLVQRSSYLVTNDWWWSSELNVYVPKMVASSNSRFSGCFGGRRGSLPFGLPHHLTYWHVMFQTIRIFSHGCRVLSPPLRM